MEPVYTATTVRNGPVSCAWMMLRRNSTNRAFAAPQEERRLLGQAKSGDMHAFMQLYDAYLDRIYRYVYFLALDDMAAEAITSRVFISAWEYLKHTWFLPPSFAARLYNIATKQVDEYYRSHRRIVVPDDGFALVARQDSLEKDFQGIFDPQAVRNTLQLLTEDQQRLLIFKFTLAMPVEHVARIMGKLEGTIRELERRAFQALGEIDARKEVNMSEFQRILEECLPKLMSGATTVDECLARYPEHASQLRPLLRTVYFLNLAGTLKPTPPVNVRTREKIIQYLRFHRPAQQISVPLRTAFVIAALIIAFVITGTARAQRAMPGDVFYGWKRASEKVWRAVSPDPVGTDIQLANRRLGEWMATKNDPQSNQQALTGYKEVISRLKVGQDTETLNRLVPVIGEHERILDGAGLDGTNMENYVAVQLQTISSTVATQVPPTAVPPAPTEVVAQPTQAPAPTEAVVAQPTAPPPAEAAPVDTEVPPTEVAPTEVPPTEIPPTEVPPTEIPPTDIPATDVPATDVPATDVPATDVAPTVVPPNVPVP